MNVKIIVTGPFAAGKTQFIKTISEIDVVETEKVITSKDEKDVKDFTTVAMDFGRITIDKDLVLYLFGTPGQSRFEFMWDILSEGALGVVVLVDSTKGESIIEGEKDNRLLPHKAQCSLHRCRKQTGPAQGMAP